MRRFLSGSLTPASAARKRSAASTVTSGTCSVSRKARSTSARSPSRSRPWSTKMQVSRSPTARCTRAAATDESTPPESPQITRRSPTRSRTRAIASSTNAPGVHVPAQPHMPRAKLRRIRPPASVCTTSGWNCTPTIGSLRCATAANGEFSLVAITSKPGGRRSTRSPWLIHTVRSTPPGSAANSGWSRSTFSSARPYSRSSAFSTSPPSW